MISATIALVGWISLALTGQADGLRTPGAIGGTLLICVGATPVSLSK